jgi:hypothetical protein
VTLTMSVRNLLESFEDKERVSKIQGLINEMMTFMGDDMAMITGPYDELLSLDDVIDKGLILFMSLNVNVNERAVTALGRMLLQNLQLMIGRRYSRAEEGEHQPFVSVIMDMSPARLPTRTSHTFCRRLAGRMSPFYSRSRVHRSFSRLAEASVSCRAEQLYRGLTKLVWRQPAGLLARN